MKRLRVLVAEDSLTVRKRLVEVLGADPGIEVVGEAADGKQAIELCQQLRPDVLSLDMIMPELSGQAVTEYVMAYCPTPILVVSSSVNRGELFKTYDALAAGAVEVMEKPRADETDGRWEQRFLANVKLVARVKVVTHLRGRHGGRVAAVAAAGEGGARRCRLVALGASTGGPSALVRVLQALPRGFPLPVLIVIHIDEPFGSAFADWLDGQSAHTVRIARDGQGLDGPGVFMAPPGHHMVVRGQRLYLDDGPERFSCRPSVDVLFDSVAREVGAGAAACLLTGMGQDGARGLLAVRLAGGQTVAQDEASCVVYGMPREAALIGAAQRVLPLDEIGPALAQLAEGDA